MSSKIQEVNPINNEKPTKSRIFLAGILFLTLLVAYLDRVNLSVIVADKSFLTQMGITGKPVLIGLLSSVFLFAYGISNVILGPFGDFIGPKKAMLIAISFWILAMTMGGLVSTFSFMIAARILLGAGEGLHWPMQSLYVKNWFPIRERGKANSAWLLGLFVGPAIAMPIFVQLTTNWGWRSTFTTLALVGLIPLLLIAVLTKDRPSVSKLTNQQEIDYIKNGSDLSTSSSAEAETEGTLKNLFLKDYRFWFLTIAYLGSSSIWWGTMAWLPSYLKTIRNFSFAQLGSLASLPYILGAITVIVCGYWSDRTGKRTVFGAVGLTLASLFILFGAKAQDNYISAYLLSCGIGSIGIGIHSFWSALQNITPPRQLGAASGILNGVAQFGSAFIPTVIGFFIQLSGGSYNGGLFFLVGLGLMGAALMAVLAVKKI
ncbi:MFS transporter [Desulfitobacterium sp. AusDCA]|uniref:MFS transporter n=1 Tax=Desulfitobacterium sp. AusDCA TaxID=3240383 RepID=UPI003DA6F5F8